MIVLGLGGNVGGDEEILARFASVADAFGVWGAVTKSRVYRTAPVGPEQPDFLNAAIGFEPDHAVPDLVATLRETERRLGRDRANETRWGPRPIDIDVLLWDSLVLRSPIEIPHPRLRERRFALEPLADLVPESTIIPGAGRLADLLEAVRDQSVAATDLAF